MEKSNLNIIASVFIVDMDGLLSNFRSNTPNFRYICFAILKPSYGIYSQNVGSEAHTLNYVYKKQ